jgi:uncharacterized protein YecE (DUF72 family)
VTEVRVGLCGFTMAVDRYIGAYGVVEVQQTFYEPPREVTLRRWRAEVPDRFEFTLKAWQLVTHDAASPTYRRLKQPLTPEQRAEVGSFRLTPTVVAAWKRTLACAAILRATAVLLQCPRSFRPEPDNVARLRAFFSAVDRPVGVRMLWEPRGPWPADLVRDLCSELAIVHVVDPFVDATVTPEATYYRLHGITGARHVYSDAELERLAGMLPSGASQPAYVMFNNLPRIGDAARFSELLARGSPAPASHGPVA